MDSLDPQVGDSSETDLTPVSYRYNLDSLDEYMALTEKMANDGRLEESVELMREATLRYPESPTGKYNLGVALYLQLREDKSRNELWESLVDDELLAEEAVNSLEAALVQDPGFISAYNNLGALYAMQGRTNDALDCYEKSLSIMPDQPDVRADFERLKAEFDQEES